MAITKEKKKGKAPSWMKKGGDAKKAVEKEEVAAKQRAEQQNKAFRFRLKPDDETQITFLDGNLDEDGCLDVTYIYEHTVFVGGRWTNFICTQDEDNSCPICEGGDNPSLVALLTVIDHSSYQGQSQVYKDTRKLFVAKAGTVKQLQKFAQKREGLAGCTFDVSRTDGKKAAVGDVFDFDEKWTLKALAKEYKDTTCEPLNLEEELTFIPSSELRKLGFGITGVGGESEPSESGEGYADEL